MEIVKLAAKEAAQEVLSEASPNLKLMAREESWKVSKEAISAHVDNCKVPGQVKIGYLKLIIFGLVCGSSGGLVTAVPSIIKFIEAIH
jgi:hypothetical protein